MVRGPTFAPAAAKPARLCFSPDAPDVPGGASWRPRARSRVTGRTVYERNRHVHLAQAGAPGGVGGGMATQAVRIAMVTWKRGVRAAVFWTRAPERAGCRRGAAGHRDSHGIRTDAPIGDAPARCIRRKKPCGRTHGHGRHGARARGGSRCGATTERSEAVRSVAIYARVSSEQQAQQATIDSQVSALKQRVAADGHVLLPQQRVPR